MRTDPEKAGAWSVPAARTSTDSLPESAVSGSATETSDASIGPATAIESAFEPPKSSEPWTFRFVPSPTAWNSSKTSCCFPSTMRTSPDVESTPGRSGKSRRASVTVKRPERNSPALDGRVNTPLTASAPPRPGARSSGV